MRTAEDRLELAVNEFIKRYPYFTPILQMAHAQLTDNVPTMGLTIRNDRIYLLVGREFAERCTDEELVGVLHHEINHLVLDHLFFDPKDYPDHRARTIAEEVTANELIPEGEPLPGEPVLLEHFPELVPDEDTHTRYKRLEGEPNSPRGQRGSSGQRGDDDSEREDQGEPGGDGAPGDKPPSGGDSPPSPTECDCTQRPSMREAMRQELRDKLGQGFDPAAVQNMLRSQQSGDEKASNAIRLSEVSRTPQNWKTLLKEYAKKQRPRAVLHRPNRRFPDLVGIIPGKMRERPKKLKVLAAIDTSGSMDSDQLSIVNRELIEMARHAKLLIVECDESIQKIHNYSSALDAVHGGGGTDLRPPLRAALLAEHRPDVIVYFTDGFADTKVPGVQPNTQVIWCLTPGGVRPASWGKVIQLD